MNSVLAPLKLSYHNNSTHCSTSAFIDALEQRYQCAISAGTMTTQQASEVHNCKSLSQTLLGFTRLSFQRSRNILPHRPQPWVENCSGRLLLFTYVFYITKKIVDIPLKFPWICIIFSGNITEIFPWRICWHSVEKACTSTEKIQWIIHGVSLTNQSTEIFSIITTELPIVLIHLSFLIK